MSMWTEANECGLCGAKGRDIHTQLVEWLDALPGMKWSHVARCDDRTACRARAQERDEPWLVREESVR